MVLIQLSRLAAIIARSSSSSAISYYDIVIVGGGMVGNAMACSIGTNEVLKEKKVLLLESTSPKLLVKSPIFSNRTSAITPASVQFFKKIGVWEKFLDYRAKRVDRYECFDSCTQSSINFAPPDSNSVQAYIVENDVVVAHLLDRIKEACKNITLKTNVKVVDFRTPESLLEDAKLVLDDSSEVETSLIIGADGGNSVIRKALGEEYTWWTYGQKGVVAVVELENAGKNNIAWQRFSRFGPIALLPLSENMSNLIWTTSDTHAEKLLATKPEEFVSLLNHYLFTNEYQSSITNGAIAAIDNVLNNLFQLRRTQVPTPPRIKDLQSDSRAAFPLSFGHSHSYISTRVALIGDAAHRIHPLGGLGVNLGWSDVQKLTACLMKCVKEGSDLGSINYLSEYDTNAQMNNLPQQLACDWINRLFRTNCFPAVFLRGIGLYGVNRLTPIKDLITARMTSDAI